MMKAGEYRKHALPDVLDNSMWFFHSSAFDHPCGSHANRVEPEHDARPFPCPYTSRRLCQRPRLAALRRWPRAEPLLDANADHTSERALPARRVDLRHEGRVRGIGDAVSAC